MSTVQQTQVLIIGAGLSGLSAAKHLTDNGVDVIVLDARDRVGGRTYTTRNNVVEWVDLGGSYVGPSQNHILRLANDIGVETYKIFSDLSSIQFSRGKRFTYTTQWAKFGFFSPLAWFDVNFVMRKMEKMMEMIPVEDPWNSPHAIEWDDMSISTFVEKECWTRHGREFILSTCQANLASDPAHVSLLWALWYVKCCDGNRRIWNVDNGAQERKFVGGSMTVSEKLAELLGDKVVLNSQVCTLTQTDSEVTVTNTDNITYKADYVIMAIPLPMQLKLHYDPPLPALRNQLIQRTPVGCVIKANLYYKYPFWREKGFNGFISCFDGQLVVGNVLDDCRPGFNLAALTVFIFTDHAIQLQELSQEARLKVVTQDLARTYSCDDALYPVHFEEHNWLEEQYSGGCYVCTFAPGVLSRFGKIIREPFQRVFFAGTETATSWPGYMNGAVQAGERAAREAMHELGIIKESEIWIQEPPFKGVPALPFQKTFFERHPISVGTILSITGISSCLVLGAAALYAYTHIK